MSSVVSASSSTSSASTTDLFNGKIFGLQSGLDVDSMVTGMVSDIQSQIDKANQSKQKLQWKQTAYQNIVTALTTFNDSFLALSGAGSVTATDALQTYTAASSNSALVTAKATTGATGAVKNITVYQSAAAASVSNSSHQIGGGYDIGSLSAGQSFSVTINGVTQQVALSSSDLDNINGAATGAAKAAALQSALQTDINTAFGGNVVSVSAASGNPTATDTTGNTGTLTIGAASGYSANITVSAPSSGASTLDALGVASGTSNYQAITGTAAFGTLTAGVSNVFNVTIDGVKKTVALSSGDVDTINSDITSKDYDGAADIINQRINAAFGYTYNTDTNSGGIAQATLADGTLRIGSTAGYTSWITVSSVASTDLNGAADALSAFNISSGTSNRLDLSQKASDVFKGVAFDSDTGAATLNVNGVKVDINSSDSLYTVLNEINSSAAGINVSYNSTTGTVSATAANTGAAYSFQLVQPVIASDTAETQQEKSNADDVFQTLGFTSDSIHATQQGQDAVFSLDGGATTMTRAGNSFTVDGVNYTINGTVGYDGTNFVLNGSTSTAPPSASITFTQDTSTAVKNIQNFVSAYNALLSAVTTAIDTKPDSDYAPLTDAQKEKMSDTDISNWNSKAQEGILYNDDTLQSLEQGLRDLVSQQVTTSDGTTITLGSLGIREDTSNDYTTAPGKLVFDNGSTDTLTAMLQNHPQEVQDLFTKQSKYAYLIDDTGTVTQNGTTVSRQTARKNEEGIAYRLQDIISDFTATNKSALLQGKLTKIIGSADDGDATNSVYDQLTAINSKITDYQAKMTKKKNQLYSKFSLLESMMAKFNSQSGAITSLMSSGG